MIITTSPTIQNKEIIEYHGIVSSEVVFGANIIRDIFAGFRDFFGGRTKSYEKIFSDGRAEVIRELETRAIKMNGNAIVAVDFDYETINNSMLMVAATGTTVTIK